MPEPKREQTLQRVHKHLQKIGGMPIFSASDHQVRADPDAMALALAVKILKDGLVPRY